jgi:hypothetical protein
MGLTVLMQHLSQCHLPLANASTAVNLRRTDAAAAPVQETKKSIVEALEAVAAYFYDGPVRNTSVVAACEKALNELAGKEIYKSWTPKDQAKLEDCTGFAGGLTAEQKTVLEKYFFG